MAVTLLFTANEFSATYLRHPVSLPGAVYASAGCVSPLRSSPEMPTISMNVDDVPTPVPELVAALKARAIRLLARREHSRAELKQKLSRKHSADEPLSDELLESVLDQLADEGYQSDQRFAELLIRQRINNGYGELDIAARLKKKGIDKTLAGRVFKQFVAENDVDWYAQCAEVLVTRSEKLQRFNHKGVAGGVDNNDNNDAGVAILMDQRMRNRLIRFLQQRGFKHDQVLYALDHAANESVDH